MSFSTLYLPLSHMYIGQGGKKLYLPLSLIPVQPKHMRIMVVPHGHHLWIDHFYHKQVGQNSDIGNDANTTLVPEIGHKYDETRYIGLITTMVIVIHRCNCQLNWSL